MNDKADFTQGSILKKLIAFMMPVLGALILQAAYGAVDLLVVGRFGSTSGLSAVSTGSQVLNLVTFVVIQFAMGITVLIARYLGEKRPDQIGSVIGGSAVVFTMIAACLFIVMVGFAHPISVLMQAPKEAVDLTSVYVRICGGGIFFIVAYNLLSAIFRGLGDSKSPLLFVFVACIVNVIGDLVLVAGLHMDAAGAAIATVFAQMVSAAMALWMAGKKLPQRIGARRLRRWLEHLWAMVRTGIPLALQSVLFPVANSIVQAAVNTMGTDTIAAWGVCDKLDMLIWLLADAMGPALTTYTAQNMGAGRWDRVCKGNRIGAAMSVAAVGTVSLGLYFLTAPLGGLFVPVQDAAAVVPQAVAFMRRMAPFFLFYALAESFSGACCGTGDTVRPMILTLLSICLLRVLGILLVLPRQHTMECIIDIYISSWIAAGIGFLILWQWEKNRVQKT